MVELGEWVVLGGQAGTITKLDRSKIQVELYADKKKLWRSLADVVPMFGGPSKTAAEVGDFVKLAGGAVGQVLALNEGRWQIQIASTGNKVWRGYSDIAELPSQGLTLLRGTPAPHTDARAAASAQAASTVRETSTAPATAAISAAPAAVLANKARDLAEEESIRLLAHRTIVAEAVALGEAEATAGRADACELVARCLHGARLWRPA
jgi:preprotein translocase subunit YajC